MSRSAKLCLLCALFAGCVLATFFQKIMERRWQQTPPSELYAVVWNQLNAFRQDDYPAAYHQVSTGYQEKFNIEAFADLARIEFPGLLRATRVEFGAVQFDGRRAMLPAYFILSDGDIVPCIYTLIREENGWKIDGTRIMKRWPSQQQLGGLRA